LKLFIAGDSIMAQYTIRHYPMTGIGMVLGLFLKPEVRIENYALPGRSTKSYYTQGIPNLIEQEITEGDYLLICFGHNDEKAFDDYLYTEPFGAYQENLRKLINLARNAGATPILVTSLERRSFMDATDAWKDPSISVETAYTLRHSAHTEYAQAMKQLAEQENVALIDLLAMSRKALEHSGPVGSAKWYMNLAPGEYAAYPNGVLDNTHLNYAGAVNFAGLIAEGLKELGAPYTDLLLDNDSQQ
jgi:lysophospholipase L1-like esterase